jgi:hypothetical protein
VQSFKTFTGDLVRLADWLAACGVTSVAMDATGVYWMPIYEILEARGFEVLLVNARHLMNLQLPLVVSDMTGVTGLRILRDIVAGQRDPEHLATHRDYRCRASHAEIVAALTGHYRPEHLFALQQNLEAFDLCQATRRVRPHDRSPRPYPLRPHRFTTDSLARTARDKKPRDNEPRFEIRTPLPRDRRGPFTRRPLVEALRSFLGGGVINPTGPNVHGRERT